MKLTEEVANQIYDILAEECGAYDVPNSWSRETFVAGQTSEFIREYRFQGKLGFGGKFWRNAARWYVNNYTEDETPERVMMMEAANSRLVKLRTTVGREN